MNQNVKNYINLEIVKFNENLKINFKKLVFYLQKKKENYF